MNTAQHLVNAFAAGTCIGWVIMYGWHTRRHNANGRQQADKALMVLLGFASAAGLITCAFRWDWTTFIIAVVNAVIFGLTGLILWTDEPKER